MNESEQGTPNVCEQHAYGQEFINAAHGNRATLVGHSFLEEWHQFAWDDPRMICDECNDVSSLIVSYDTTWAEIDEDNPEGPIYFQIKVQIGDAVAWAWLANPDVYVHGIAIEIVEMFATEEEVKAFHQRIEENQAKEIKDGDEDE
jgi:hypothetical protein